MVNSHEYPWKLSVVKGLSGVGGWGYTWGEGIVYGEGGDYTLAETAT